MPNWLKPFKIASDVLQKPQSIASGVLNEVTGQADDARRFIDQYERAIVEDTPENAIRYKAALASVGGSGNSKAGPGGITNLSSILQGAVTGAKGNVRPSDIMMAHSGDDSSIGAQVGANVANLGLDPLLVLGGGSGAAPKFLQGTKAAKLFEAAGHLGPLAEDADKAEKAAQLARRLYQGSLVSGGNPLLAIGAATGIGTAERAGAALVGRLGAKAAEDLVGDGLSNSTALEKWQGKFDQNPVQGARVGTSPPTLPSEPLALNSGPEYRQTYGPAIPMGRVPMGTGLELSQDLGAQLGRIPQAPMAMGGQAGVGAFPPAPAELAAGPRVTAMGSPNQLPPIQQQASRFLEGLDPALQKKMVYLRAKAIQGDKRAMLMLANLMEQMDEDPAEKLIRLATGS